MLIAIARGLKRLSKFFEVREKHAGQGLGEVVWCNGASLCCRDGIGRTFSLLNHQSIHGRSSERDGKERPDLWRLTMAMGSVGSARDG